MAASLRQIARDLYALADRIELEQASAKWIARRISEIIRRLLTQLSAIVTE